MENKKWAEEILEKIYKKEVKVVKRNSVKIPYTTEDGIFDDMSFRDRICWWTNGFWAGQLWLLYNAFRDENFKAVAKEIEKKLDVNLMSYQGMDHDSGFKWVLTSGAHYLDNGSEKAKNRFMLAAGNLAGRLNLNAGLIRAWNDPGNGENAGLAIIDSMMNLPLLYRASEITKDPRFKQIAMCHADHAAKDFVRENGSVKHIVTFDPESGEITGARGGQGMNEDSSWTRGQAWALYGFALSYRHTKKQEYLDTAVKIADYVLSQIPESGIVPVDFMQDAGCDYEDSSAAAIFACGLLELGEVDGKYTDAAAGLLKTLTEKRCCFDESRDYLLENCSAAYNDDKHNITLIYGDYFYTEALCRLSGNELFLW